VIAAQSVFVGDAGKSDVSTTLDHPQRTRSSHKESVLDSAARGEATVMKLKISKKYSRES
jgi:hypothetical protein